MLETKDWVQLLIHWPAGLVVSVWLLSKMGAFFGPLIKESVQKWVEAQVKLTDSLRIGVEAVAKSLTRIEDKQERHSAEFLAVLKCLQERTK